jgi:hypothetical protein
MDKQFIKTLMEELLFPAEAVTDLSEKADKICAEAEQDFDAAEKFFSENDFNWKETAPLLKAISEKTGVHEYQVHMLFILACAKNLRAAFAKKGISDRIFLDTMEDAQYKLFECKEVHGIWGTFVAFWYDIFFKENLVKLGRLEFENVTSTKEEVYEKYGVRIEKGTPVKSLHIPSCGPLPLDVRMESYRHAYEFFKDELNGKPLVCICHSWLLHSSVRSILSPTSNTVDFMNDFDIIETEDSEEFHDKWRIFGKDSEKPDNELPEDTSMRRAYKKWLSEGKKTGAGLGVLIFDGEKLLTRE